MNNIRNSIKSYLMRMLSLIILFILLITNSSNVANAASVSKTLGQDTTFQIQEYEEYEEFKDYTITVTVYDKITGEPIGDIKVELYYKDSDLGFTGSNGNYLTDKDGILHFDVSSLTEGDNYHFEINTPGYYPYIGEGFELTGDMNVVIYLDPIVEDDEDDSIPLIPLDPSITVPLDPPSDPAPEPLPEENQKPLPDVDDTVGDDSVKTGDDSKVIEYLSIATVALIFIIVLLLKKRREDDEDIE